MVSERIDEAEGVTAMISDWLELDAADDWIRHDAEIVSERCSFLTSYTSPFFVEEKAPSLMLRS